MKGGEENRVICLLKSRRSSVDWTALSVVESYGVSLSMDSAWA